jgi:thiamine-phosphate pyrophosphorylase
MSIAAAQALGVDVFYPIVPDAAWVARLVPLGVRTIQLRLKDASGEEVLRQVRESMGLCQRHRCTLIVNDYWQAAIGLGARFIHLGQEDLAGADLAAIRKADLKLGISTHTPEELDIALAAKPDYVALGPIYETKLKAMRYAPQGPARLAGWKARIACPLVAIAGITLERAPDVMAAGADSCAVVTDFITHPEPEARVKAWLAWAEKARG